MAGDWLKIETATPDKPEVLMMADVLGIDPDAVVGKLIRLWTWFDSHSEEGNAPSVSRALLDRNVGVSGFVDCVISVGWMSEEGGNLNITNFDNHNGASAKKRANTARRVAKLKALREAEEKQRLNDNAKGNADDSNELTPEALAEALAREEKRREESKESNSKGKSTQRFKKPTTEEIAEYCQSRNNGIDAEQFYHNYETKGWNVNGSPMKNWKSAVITWEKRNKKGNHDEKNTRFSKTGFNASTAIAAAAIDSYDPDDTF